MGKHFTIMHAEVAEIVQGIGSPDLAEVDDATVTALMLIDVRHIKIAMREVCLFTVEAGIKLICTSGAKLAPTSGKTRRYKVSPARSILYTRVETPSRTLCMVTGIERGKS